MPKLLDYKRVLGLTDMLFIAGTYLKKRGIKFTGLAAIMTAGAVGVDALIKEYFNYDLPGVSTLNAALFTGALALITIGPGHLFTSIAKMLSSAKIEMADANALNLMEDLKKSNKDHHLKRLWDRVFKQEAELSPDTGISEEKFMKAATFSINNSLPQKYETSLTGFELFLLEDWYDGGFFNTDDKELREQFNAHDDIHDAREEVGIPLLSRMKIAVFGDSVPSWHTRTMRKVGIEVGIAMSEMNRKHTRETEPDYFDAQHFLWKHPKLDEMVLKDFPENGEEVLSELNQCRRTIIRETLSKDMKTAHNQVYWMFGQDFERALELILDFDVERAAGLDSHSVLEDIETLDGLMMCPTYPSEKAAAKTKTAMRHLEEIDAFIAEEAPEIAEDRQTLRAVRTGYHTNVHKIRKLVAKKPREAARVIREKIAPCIRKYTQTIRSVRIHYELTIIQLTSYVDLINVLGAYDREEPCDTGTES